MKVLLVLLCATMAGCSAGGDEAASAEQGATPGTTATAVAKDLRQFAGRTFSSFVEANPDFVVKRRAVSDGALAAFAESDGIQNPGELRQLRGRDVLMFATCKRDRCSQASNIIFVDLSNDALHIVNQTGGKAMVVVDGPPDIAAFARTSCEAASCNWDGTPVRAPAYD